MEQRGDREPTVGSTAAADPQSSSPRRWAALVLLATVFFMSILDGTIVYVALPPIQEDFSFSVSGVQWVMSAYLLTFGGLLLLGGRLADLLGRRRIFMTGVTLFTASSLLCGLAWAAEVLVVSRVLQGVGAAMMAPSALSLVMAMYDEGPERNKALGLWGAIGGFGGTAGLLIGGPVTHGLGWEWVFFINVPIGVTALLLSPALLPESRDEGARRKIDFAGAVTITSALVLLVYAITGAPDAGWLSTRTLGLLAASAALVAVFIVVESRSAAPLVPLRFFRSRTLAGGNLVLVAAGMSVDGMLIIVTLYAQQSLGYTALQFGLMTSAMTLMSIVGAFAGQAAVTKVGVRPVSATAMVLIGIGCLLLSWLSPGGSFFSDLFAGLVVFGAGLGAAFVSAQIAALSGVAESESGLAAGLVDTSFSIGGALGLAVLTTAAVSRTNDATAAGITYQVALTEGFRTALTVAIAFALGGLLIALTLLRRPHGDRVEASNTTSSAPAEKHPPIPSTPGENQS